MNTFSTQSKAALLRAIDVLGGQSAFAKAVGKEQGHVSHWIKTGRLPADYCPLAERATAKAGQRVTCEELRSDIAWNVLRGTRKAKTIAAEVTHG